MGLPPPSGSTPDTQPSTTTASSRMALVCLSMATLLSSLGVSIANVALPTLAAYFNASTHQAQWVVIAYLLALTSLIVTAGNLGDRFGHRRVLISGIGIFTIASVISALSTTLWGLILARGLQGFGAAILTALTVAIARGVTSDTGIGKAMGLMGSVSAIGTALGPSAGGGLLAYFGWSSLFWLMTLLGVLTLLLSIRFLPDNHKDTDTASIDIWGTLILGSTLLAYSLAVSLGGGDFSWLNIGLLVIAAMGLVLFFKQQARTHSPLLQLAVLGQRELGGALFMNLLVAAVMMATLVVGPFYLSAVLNLSETSMGLVLGCGPVISSLSGVPAGVLVDRWGGPIMVKIGLSLMAIAAAGLAWLPEVLGLVGYLAAISLLTPGYQLFLAANNTHVMTDIPTNQRGRISSLLGLSRHLGLLSGAALLGMVFVAASTNPEWATDLQADMTRGFQFTFSLAAGLLISALAVALVISPNQTVH